jgi:hypothetical protein
MDESVARTDACYALGDAAILGAFGPSWIIEPAENWILKNLKNHLPFGFINQRPLEPRERL